MLRPLHDSRIYPCCITSQSTEVMGPLRWRQGKDALLYVKHKHKWLHMSDVSSEALSLRLIRPLQAWDLRPSHELVSMYTPHCSTVHIHHRACQWDVYYSHIPADQTHTYIKGRPLTICFCEGRCSDKAGRHSQGAAALRRSHALLICGPHAGGALGTCWL